MVQTEIKKRPFYDANGSEIGCEAALAMGIPGEFADDAPQVVHAVVPTADTAYGRFLDDGVVVNPKTGVRFGGGLADSLAIKAGTAGIEVATKGHVFIELCVGTSKAAVAKGATIYRDSAGKFTTASSGNTNSNYKLLTPVRYKAAPTASAFSASSTYAVGAYVTKDGKIYKCVQAITSAAAWDGEDWTEVGRLPDEQGAENFKLVDGKYYTIVKIEL